MKIRAHHKISIVASLAVIGSIAFLLFRHNQTNPATLVNHHPHQQTTPKHDDSKSPCNGASASKLKNSRQRSMPSKSILHLFLITPPKEISPERDIVRWDGAGCRQPSKWSPNIPRHILNEFGAAEGYANPNDTLILVKASSRFWVFAKSGEIICKPPTTIGQDKKTSAVFWLWKDDETLVGYFIHDKNIGERYEYTDVDYAEILLLHIEYPNQVVRLVLPQSPPKGEIVRLDGITRKGELVLSFVSRYDWAGILMNEKAYDRNRFKKIAKKIIGSYDLE